MAKKGARVVVEVLFRDDKTKKFKCNSLPSLSGGYLYLNPEGKTGRTLVYPAEAIALVDYWLESK